MSRPVVTNADGGADARDGTAPGEIGPGEWSAYRRIALVAAVAALALAAVGGLLVPDRFFRSYLVAWQFWLGLPLGALGLLMIHNLTGGEWGLVIRRPLEAMAGTLPVMAVLFLPVLLGLGRLYEWTHGEHIEEEHLRHAVEAKSAYLNVPFFLLRAGIYWAFWLIAAWLMNRWSAERDAVLARRDDEAAAGVTERLGYFSGPGLVALVLTVTFAAVDWTMSITAEWFSSIWGIYTIGGYLVSSLSAAIVLVMILSARPPVDRVLTPARIHDNAKLLGAFVMLWAYFAFSQYLIIWSGNLPEETIWFYIRTTNGWGWVSAILALGQFVLPFFLLLFRRIKKQPLALTAIAIFLLVMHYVDVYWQVMPGFERVPLPHFLDVACLAGVGAAWLWALTGNLSARPLLTRPAAALPSAAEGHHA
jgi:hypothetical protein